MFGRNFFGVFGLGVKIRLFLGWPKGNPQVPEFCRSQCIFCPLLPLALGIPDCIPDRPLIHVFGKICYFIEQKQWIENHFTKPFTGTPGSPTDDADNGETSRTLDPQTPRRGSPLSVAFTRTRGGRDTAKSQTAAKSSSLFDAGMIRRDGCARPDEASRCENRGAGRSFADSGRGHAAGLCCVPWRDGSAREVLSKRTEL